MTYRIAWLSPLTPASGIGTFSHTILRDIPSDFEGEPIDLTVFYVDHQRLYRSRHRSMRIGDSADFHEILGLFDLIVYNIGNNREHHEPIFELLQLYPGIVICHDFVYQHYLADLSMRRGRSFASFASLLLKHGDASAAAYLRRSRITSRTGRIRYSPWDTELSVTQPMSESILALGSALIVHSDFAQRHVARSFEGPVLTLGMPHDQKPAIPDLETQAWTQSIATKSTFRMASFGHIQSTKCLDLAVAALAGSPLLRRRIRYTIAGFVGSAGYYQHLKEMVSSAQLDDVVTFELDVSERRLRDLMQEADIFLNLRRPNTEGASVSLIEQLETGKPVVVLDSGCYAEIPPAAAVKAPADATADDIRAALESLIGTPESMPAIGAAGQAFARSWSCASYGRELLRFIFEHRDLLEKRAKMTAVNTVARPPCEADAWVKNLAHARASFRYLHANALATDPALILGRSADDLCRQTANVIFGEFDNPRLDRALARFFARLDSRAAYWACVRFAIIADAAFGDDAQARERLKSLAPCYDPELWAVIEAFPPRQHLTAATLMLAKRVPTPEELTTVGLDDEDGFPKRLRTRDLVRRFETARTSTLDKLERWLDESCAPSLDGPLPEISENFECDVGDQLFRRTADLSGFYAMEPDHAWTRGTHGFLGLRLNGDAVRIDVLVHHINASPEQPVAISISHGDAIEELSVTDGNLHWLSIRIRPPSEVLWLKFSTTSAAQPDNGRDDRVLGVCFRQLRVSFEAKDMADPASILRRFIDKSGSWARQPAARAVSGRDAKEARPNLLPSGG